MQPLDTCPEGRSRLVLSRRGFLGAAATFTAWAGMPRLALAGGADPRFLVVVLRGALDGLSAVAPAGDPDLVRMRGEVALGGARKGVPLDDLFVLSPQLPGLARLYAAREAVIVHAVATPYRDRSHFDGQDVLESGVVVPGGSDTGWLGRALAALPSGGAARTGGGFAAGAAVPLVMRGPAPVATWLPAGFPEASSDTRSRLLDLYRHTDSGLAAAMEAGLRLSAVSGGEQVMAASALAFTDAEATRRARQVEEVAAVAGRLLAEPGGPRIGTIDIDGWDTHADSDPTKGRLGQSLAALDGALGALERSLGPAWKETAVLIVTEFGRTVAINGTGGTDHGTATTAFLVGGAVAGGRVVADWPGLKPKALYEGRDLMPTTDLRAMAKGVLRDHLGFGETLLTTAVFPGSETVRPVDGLIRAG